MPEQHTQQRRSMRLRGYDYTAPGAYSVTICTAGGVSLFGEIVGGEMRLSACGQVVEDCWHEIPAHSPDVALDAFVVMPNHVHGIIIINEDRRTGEGCLAPTRQTGTVAPGCLPQIVGSFKSAVSKRINEQRGTPGGQVWQRGYYDRVVRDEGELDNFRRYIAENPLKWDLDRENPDNVKEKMRR
jgi:REP element-mobilizing transposase RayT